MDKPGRLPLHPRHPERVCWRCERFCPADAMACGMDVVRAQHPVELLGVDWLEDEETGGGPPAVS